MAEIKEPTRGGTLEKGPGAVILGDEERRSIALRANIRRRQTALQETIASAEPGSDESVSHSLREKFVQTRDNLFKQMAGELPALSEDKEVTLQNIEKLITRGNEYLESGPILAAYDFVLAAKLRLMVGQNPEAEIEATQEALKKTGTGRYSAYNCMPDAMLIGVQKKWAERLPLPDYARVASAIVDDRNLLANYALTLKEEERGEFLQAVPEAKRKAVSLALDRAVSELISEKHAISKEEKEQRGKVQERAGTGLREAVAGETESKLVVKMLAQTLRELEGEDSARLLRELGGLGLAKAADEDKQGEIKRLFSVARIITELAKIDQDTAGNLTMKFLGRRELPKRLFIYFFNRMMDNGYLTKNTASYLNNTANTPFLKKLIAQYPNQFNTVIDTLVLLPNYDPAANEKEVFEAIHDLDSLTPIIFERYRQADAAGKKKLAGKIRELKPKFFQNKPIKDILPAKDRDILAEMVYLAYKPVGMSFSQVQEWLGRLKDRTEHLEGFSFPENGYDFSLESKKYFVLKKGEYLEKSRLAQFRDMLGGEFPQTDEQAKDFSLLLGRLAKAGTEFKPEELKTLFSVIASDQMARDFLKRHEDLRPENHYNFLNELKEILGVYFKDHYHERLANFLGANPAAQERLLKILSSPDRQEVLRRKLGAAGKDMDWENIRSKEDIARVLSNVISALVLKSTRQEIAGNINKFAEAEAGEEAVKERSGLKAYLSKNIGSFFAKASAGICTAADSGLFSRKDHFHINIVENEEAVRANIQAYLIEEEGGRSLVLRGFNPNVDFLQKIDPGIFCEAVIGIAKKFARENGLINVYITEDLGAWHALSNRERVNRYLMGKYLKDKNRKSFHLAITDSQSVSSIFSV